MLNKSVIFLLYDEPGLLLLYRLINGSKYILRVVNKS